MKTNPAWLQSLLEEHFLELQMLGEMRLAASIDADYRLEDLPSLDERLEAHVDALLLAGKRADGIVLEGLGAEESDVVFASALVLLRKGDTESATKLAESLHQATPPQREGIYQACCYAGLGRLAPWLEQHSLGEDAALGTVCAQALAFHGLLKSRNWQQWLEHDDVEVRRRAWETVGFTAT